ncbi:hypothetical protein J5839_01850 [Methanosarcinaceae archaeon]|nr:hypothetical protein [Methanosarcinaceae archaeon]
MRPGDRIKKNGTAILMFLIFLVIFGFILTIRLSETENQTGHHVMLGPVSFLVGTSMDTLTNVVVMMIVILVMYVFLWRK